MYGEFDESLNPHNLALKEAEEKYKEFKSKLSSTQTENSNLPKEYVDFCERTAIEAYAKVIMNKGNSEDTVISDESMPEIIANIESTLKKDSELKNAYMSLIAKGDENYDMVIQSEKLGRQISSEILRLDETHKSAIDKAVENSKPIKKLRKFDSLEKGEGGLFKQLKHKIKKIVFKSYSRAKLKAQVDEIKAPLKQEFQSFAPQAAPSFAEKVINERKKHFHQKVEKRSR